MPGKDVLVCGTLNLETSLPIGSFPLSYEPVNYRRSELSSHPSGVGFNVARALRVLGNRVRFTSMVGPDLLGTSLRKALATFDLSNEFVLPVRELLHSERRSIAGRRLSSREMVARGSKRDHVECNL